MRIHRACRPKVSAVSAVTTEVALASQAVSYGEKLGSTRVYEVKMEGLWGSRGGFFVEARLWAQRRTADSICICLRSQNMDPSNPLMSICVKAWRSYPGHIPRSIVPQELL